MAKDFAKELENMDLDELKSLQKDVAKAVTSYEERKKSEAREQLEQQAKELGFNLNELTGGKTKAKRAPALPKYANPENPADTWSGRGRKPKWLEEALANGHELEEFLIDKPASGKKATQKEAAE
jgi:DNA-binding protein H-NS